MKKMGHPIPENFLRENVGQSRYSQDPLSKDILTAIDENTKLDREVYDYARSHFLCEQ